MAGDQRNALPVGYEFDGYRVEDILGAGGFGVTYRATELTINRTVAIKEYLPAGMAWRDSRDHSVHAISDMDTKTLEWGRNSFQREAETLVNFRHPNVVSVLRFFEANQTAYMVMDYEDGESLGNILRDTGKLNQGELEEILDPLLDALEEVHKKGFLHRDIKPSNIYIRRNGSPVLLDFGAAKQNLSERSHSLNVVLTPPFAPMEQYSSSEQLGPWTDIYALGMTLFVCGTDTDPPDAMARSNAVMAGRADPIRPPQKALGKGFTDQFKEGIGYATRLLQEDRPQSVDEWRQCFKDGRSRAATRILGAADAMARPASRGPGGTQVDRARRPSRFWPTAAVIAGLLAVGGGGYAGYLHTRPDGSAEVQGLRSKLTAMEQRHAKTTQLLASTQTKLSGIAETSKAHRARRRKTALAVVTYAEKYAAEKARADKLFASGERFYYNKDKRDPRAAFPLFMSAAKLGHPKAQAIVAYMLLVGQGTRKDRPAALTWYALAAERGEQTAMMGLAHIYVFSTDKTRNYGLAFDWAARAIVAGAARGYCHLGYLHMNGRGMTADPKAAVALLVRGARKRDPWCMYQLGVAYENGKGVTRNRARAVAFYKWAADAGLNLAKDALRRLQGR